MPTPTNLDSLLAWSTSFLIVLTYYILSLHYLVKKVHGLGVWGPSQEEAFIPLLPANASSYGIGAVLLQETNKKW